MSGRFTPGVSGNPAGRPPGSRNKSIKISEELLDQHLGNMTKVLIAAALKGNMVAQKLALERSFPAPKDRPITFPLPDIDSAADLGRASAAIVKAVSNGELTPSEADSLLGVLQKHALITETSDLASEVAQLRVEIAAVTAGENGSQP